MSHRVIAGRAKGHRLQLVPGDKTRPITDRAKESLFNIIGRNIYDAYFWDLFAGTGAVGIEALSRGAELSLFTETSRIAIRTIEANLEATNLADGADVRQRDAFAALSGIPNRTFDFIFVAPPQYKEIWSRALHAIDDNPDWLAERGQVVVQIDPQEKTDITLKNLEEIDERRYGNTLLIFYAVTQTEQEEGERP